MRVTKIGSDYIRIDEDNIDDEKLLGIERVHLIKLDFFKPTETKIKKVILLYPKTRRYIVTDNIKTYNYILRTTDKKYYIMNVPGCRIISFFKKNNKVAVNFNEFTSHERDFLFEGYIFEDILKNCEVIQITQDIFDEKKDILVKWSGNVIIHSGSVLL